MIDLERKVIIVTGGAGLIGKAIITTIAENNGIPIIADINENKGYKLLEEIRKENKDLDIEFINLNITSKDSILNMIKILDSKYNRIDALINNAYPRNNNYGKDFLNVEYDDFCDNINDHLGGYFLVAQQIINYFLTQGYGNIINIASIYGVVPPRFELYENVSFTMPVEYAVIKSAIIHFTKYIAKFCKNLNIKVNTISPGGIFNGQPNTFRKKYKIHTHSKGMLNEEDLSGAILFLLSNMSKYIIGQNIIVDDGFTL